MKYRRTYLPFSLLVFGLSMLMLGLFTDFQILSGIDDIYPTNNLDKESFDLQYLKKSTVMKDKPEFDDSMAHKMEGKQTNDQKNLETSKTDGSQITFKDVAHNNNSDNADFGQIEKKTIDCGCPHV
eukprot:CAMPEP_0113325644 /NCGR_PEP_ID=MMETSP0010_2-20120614/17909_1 /TAXON_ID=216773 ORGANISM="Corethron hystrix, Strain 308" /NCGR_SAMPLE_ID=MMETSP0010_2 /ASSEMBLY_ACC=CAM_ASM_000155 /LENGTH=125 /DNA_ID=CAMNT_0000185545 /DNA_START=33 /DNA_END=406 /DNA_ORIENTATION=- /assembly_acc=CAM_ASM_000155